MLARTIIVVSLLLVGCIALAPALKTEDAITIAKQSFGDDAASAGNATSSDAVAPPQAVATLSNGAEVELLRDLDGHFRSAVTVNGVRMMMMIDSGASVVVLDEDDARAIGIFVDPLAFTGTAQTAGGTVPTMPVVIDRLQIGGIERRNVPASIVRTTLPDPLLGQSFLATLEQVNISGDRMRLK